MKKMTEKMHYSAPEVKFYSRIKYDAIMLDEESGSSGAKTSDKKIFESFSDDDHIEETER